jgi:glutaredoxin 3
MQEITIYSTKICPYCDAAKRLLTQKGYPFKDVDLSNNPDLRMKLSSEQNGWRTVPMIFIGKNFVGGFTELAALDKKGELEKQVNS